MVPTIVFCLPWSGSRLQTQDLLSLAKSLGPACRLMGPVWTEVTTDTLEDQEPLVFLLGTAPSLAHAQLGEIRLIPGVSGPRVTKSRLTEAKLPWG